VLTQELFKRRRIRRFFQIASPEELDDDIVCEHRLSIWLDGEEFIKTVISPSLVEEFLLGFLLSRRIIDGLQDVLSMEVSGDAAYITRIESKRRSLPHLELLESTGTPDIPPAHVVGPAESLFQAPLRVSVSVIFEGVRMLSEMPLYRKTGGTHCAILFSPEGAPLISAEDVGRHNSVDKVIGGGLMKDVDFANCWLAVSGRLPADMVVKPIVAGIPLVASVSAATSAGIQMGEKAGLTIVGFARKERFNCYCHPQRIL